MLLTPLQSAVPSRLDQAAVVHAVPLVDALAMGETWWDAMALGQAAPNPFSTWAWHAAWAGTATPTELAGAEVLVQRRGEEVEALLPIAQRTIRRRRVPMSALTWACGDVGCPDHVDVIASGDIDLEPLVAELAARDWTALSLTDFAEGAPGLASMADALRRRGFIVRELPLYPCSYLDLPATWEEYLARRSAKSRANLRGYERRFANAYGLHVTHYAPDRVAEGLVQLERLHTLRWQGAGAFRDERFKRLLSHLAPAMARAGRLHLATLDVDGVPVAADCSFIVGGTWFGYLSGRDPSWDHAGTGRVMMGLTLQEAIRRGLRRFDFLRGDEGYKTTWSATSRTTRELLVFRRTPRGLLHEGLERVGAWRAARRAIAAARTTAAAPAGG